MADFKFSIVRHIGVLSGKSNGWSREINLIKWNDGEPKLDIRDWSPDRTAMRKGLTFNRQEFLAMVKFLKEIRANEIVDGTIIPATQVKNAPVAEGIIKESETNEAQLVVTSVKQEAAEAPNPIPDEGLVPFEPSEDIVPLASGE